MISVRGMMITVDGDLGVAGLRITALEHTTAPIGVIALEGLGLGLSSVRNDSEAGHRSAVAVGVRPGEFAGRDPLLPSSGLQMVVVAHRVS